MLKNKMVKYKKGDIGITLLVVGVFILAVTALFVFNSGLGKISDTALDSSYVDEAWVERVSMEEILNQVAEEAFIDSYKEFVDEAQYINGLSSLKYEGKYSQFFGTFDDPKLASKFGEVFTKKFLEEMKGKKIFGQEFEESDFKFNSGKGWVEIRTSSLKVVSEMEKLSVNYSSEYVNTLEFKDLGLHSFSEISEAKKKCLDPSLNINSLEGIGGSKICLKEMLDNFKSEVTYNSTGFFLVKFETEREFIKTVGSDVKKEKIAFGFVIK